MKENFKAIKGYENYEVSDLGNVRSVDRMIKRTDGQERFIEGKPLKTQYDAASGRPIIRLYDSKTKKGRTFKISRLVMLTFVGERPDGMEICHSNGDHTDDRLVNLRYGSRSDNQIDILKHSNKCAAGKLSIEQVIEIRRAYKEKEMNQYELAKKFKVSQGNISEIVNRKLFSFVNDDGTLTYDDPKVS